jgi:hypothetical protein
MVRGDQGGGIAIGAGSATVSITAAKPNIALTVSASPTSRLAPGGVFRFHVTVTNNGKVAATIGSVTSVLHSVDSAKVVHNSCAALAGRKLAVGKSLHCTFKVKFKGAAKDKLKDVVTFVATHAGRTATVTKHATVKLTKAPKKK